MPKALYVLIVSFFSYPTFAQTYLLKEDFSSGLPIGWQAIDADGLIPNSAVSQFTNAWISYKTATDTALASTSYYMDPSGQAADYLILPKQSLLTFSKLSWEAKSVDPSFPDGYYVLLSTTDSSLSSFTDTLMTVFAEYFLWNRKSLLLDTMGYGNQDVFIAFKNYTKNGFILELDDIWLEASDFASIPKEEEIDVRIYPNPASEELNLVVKLPFLATIHTLAGVEVMRTTDHQINVRALPPGKYFITVSTTRGARTKSFIKN